jgi:SAM-dependent methyltransferase
VKVPDRVRWAVDVLDPGPADVIMEIGCGPGVAAALICERLTSGRLVAVDRSAVAIARTAQRNAAHVQAGRLAVLESTVHGIDLPPGSFDKVLSINVNLFWTGDAGRELTVLKRAMKPGGTLHVLYGGNGPTGADRVLPVVSDALTVNGFIEVQVIKDDRGIGVSARSPERA